jgi:hypothetical protein
MKEITQMILIHEAAKLNCSVKLSRSSVDWRN